MPVGHGQAPARAPLAITYLANEGFLIEAGSDRVLIDALFRAGVAGYSTLTTATRERLESATAPFHDTAFVLASHFHADHFDPAAVAAYLAASPGTRFVSTPQAMVRLREAGAAASVVARAEGVLPAEGQRERRDHRGVRLEVLNVHHGRSRPIENLGLLVEIGGYRLLHIGDAEATAADLRAAGVAADRLDVLFVPYWYLTHDDGRRAVRETGARHVVLMHVASPSIDSAIRKAGGFGPVFEGIRRDFPQARWLDRELERVELR